MFGLATVTGAVLAAFQPAASAQTSGPRTQETSAGAPGAVRDGAFDPATSTPLDAETTPTQRVWRNRDGSRTAVVTAEPTRFKDGSGTWREADLSLTSGPDATLVARSAPGGSARLAARSGAADATVTTSAGDIVLSHPGATRVQARTAANRATYDGALGGRDLLLDLTRTGVEETVVLHAVSDGPSYIDHFTLPEGVTAHDSPDGVSFADAAGRIIGSFGNGVAWDAADAHTRVSTRLRSQQGRVAVVEVSIDARWLKDPARVMPIHVDPVLYSNTYSSGDNSYIAQGYPYSVGRAGTLHVGRAYSGYLTRTLLQFPIAQSAKNPNNRVTSATFSVYNFESGSTQQKRIDVYGIGEAWSTATPGPGVPPPPIWTSTKAGPNLDGAGVIASKTFAGHGDGSCCNGAWEQFTVTSLADRWMRDQQPNYGIELIAANEDPVGNYSAYRKFHGGSTGTNSAPAMTITYVTVASAPTNVTATPMGTSARVDWTDPNPAGSVQSFTVARFDSQGGVVTETASSADRSRTLSGLTPGQTYSFAVYAQNGQGPSDPGWAPNTVTASTVPDAPVIVSVESADATEPTITWEPRSENWSPITSFTLTASNGMSMAVDGTNATASFPGLPSGASYTFTVKAVNANGESPASVPSASVVPMLAPNPPTDVGVLREGTRATLSWTLSLLGPTVDGYTAVATPATGGTPVVLEMGSLARQAVFDGLAELDPYVFAVSAKNAGGESTPVAAPGPMEPPKYVALGDSYASGEGNPAYDSGSDSNGCHRSKSKAYAKIFNSTQKVWQLTFPACSGAKIADVLNHAQHTGDTTGGQVTKVPADANLVTVMIGGNDIGFGEIVKACVLDLPTACPPSDMTERIEGIRDDLRSLFHKIRDTARTADVRAVVYPHIVTNQNRNNFCRGDGLMEDSERTNINDDQAHLDRVIRESAQAEGLNALEVEHAFGGHEICTPDAWVYGVSREDGRSFHPNPKGHKALAQHLEAVAVLRYPTVASVSPDSGLESPSQCSTMVTIRGANFTDNSEVYFGAVKSSSVLYISPSELLAEAPGQPAGVVDVTVRTNRGLNWGASARSDADRFSYVSDTQAPVTTIASNRTPNAAGWINADATIALSATDGACDANVANIEYTIEGADAAPTTSIAGPDAALVVDAEGTSIIRYRATDVWGNAEPTREFVVRLDKTAPNNVLASPARVPDRSGYYNHPVSVHWSGADPTSGIRECTSIVYSGPDTTGTTLSGTCTDIADNTSPPAAFDLSYDATAPVDVVGTAGRAPDANGWYNHEFTVQFSGADATSGIEACSSVTYAGPDNQSILLTGSCSDRAGNNATSQFGPTKYDATDPTAAIDGPAIQAKVAGDPLTGTAADNLSGVASIMVEFRDGLGAATTRPAACGQGCATWTVSTSGLVGTYFVTARAQDMAGNVGPASDPVLTLSVQ